jgi:pyruvate/2-oxoglutarate dehydrogenase complex dihydrolipoamide acyltransferase (E2) component
MGRAQRIGFLAVAAVITVVAVIVLSGGSGDEADQASAPTPTATATPTPSATAESELEARSTPTPTRTPAPRVETVTFRDGAVAGGLAKLEFDKGDTARFRVSSDTADEVHVHGYDLKQDVAAGGTVSFAFRADIDGIFEVELENSGIQLAQLRVDP